MLKPDEPVSHSPMKRKFKSKLGRGLLMFLALVIGGLGIIFIWTAMWFALLILMVPVASLIHTVLTTAYTIENDYLYIKSGFVSKVVDIGAIRKISETRNPISAPAMSLDRLEIFYNRFDSIIISPENKGEFVDCLKTINPAIDVVLNNK